jgi:hypothetical protein
MFRLSYLLLTAIVIFMATEKMAAQSAMPNAVYYVCAEQGFKLSGPTGYADYLWTVDNTGMPGADSNNIQVTALGAVNVGNSYVTRTYHLKVQNAGGCWSQEATYVVYVLPKIDVTVTGYTPPYCENLSHDITLNAKINGGTGSSALVLPTGVGVKYTWLAEPDVNIFGQPNPAWNAAILGPTDLAMAQVVTPQNSTVDNNYTVKVEYTYPSAVNVNTDVVGNCNDEYTQNVHADPAPSMPTINYQIL